MKKITFRRCTVMAAVFAACLFAAGCKPNQPNPAPNPEPAPNPAPNPAPKPAPSPSIEVPMPDTPPVVPGGTVQEETIPNPYPPSVETVNLSLTLKSISRPTAASYYGIAPSYAAANGVAAIEVKILVAVPKSIKDKATERKAAVRKQLLAKLKADYNAEYEFYTADDGTGIPSFADGSTVFVGQSETTMEVETKLTIKRATGTITDTNKSYYTVDFPSAEKNLRMKVSNTATAASLMSLVEGSAKALLDKEIGVGEYGISNNGSGAIAAPLAADYGKAFPGLPTAAPGPTAAKDIYVGKLLRHIIKTFTVKSINSSVTVGSDTYDPILGGSWMINTTGVPPGTATIASNDNLTIASSATDVNGKLDPKFDTVSLIAGDYKFFTSAAGTTEVAGKDLAVTDVIYVGKKR